ncbi:unnamed protein product [Pedinophyceae sp. YPF-701]|nr:unnamed protein product [Pedinophyceae sp. YPF-701]
MPQGPASDPLLRSFRDLGTVCDETPFAVQRRGKETFVTVSTGRAWQIYGCSKMRLAMAGPRLPAPIDALACRGDLTFAAAGGDIHVARRNTAVAVLRHHAGRVVQLMTLGDQLLSLAADGELAVWADAEWDAPETTLRMPEGFVPTCMVHPDTYLNKVLVGAQDGRMQLWNFASGRMIYEFAGWGSCVRCLAASPALDLVGVGLSDGRAVLHNIKYDEEIMVFRGAAGAASDGSGLAVMGPSGERARSGPSTGGAVTALSFRTGANANVLAAGGEAGAVCFWDLDSRKVRHILRGAHRAPVTALHFFTGEPVVMSAGADNAIHQWVLDNDDGSARRLRGIAGHAAPPSRVAYCTGPGMAGLRVLSGGDDRSLRVSSTVQDHQSRELSQGKVESRAKRLKVAAEDLKLTRVVAMDSCHVRERDWASVVTAHEGDPKAYTWRLAEARIGEWALFPPRTPEDPTPNAPATAVALSCCGNYALVGSAAGRLDVYNMQSGIHRGVYQLPEGGSVGKRGAAGARGGRFGGGAERRMVEGAETTNARNAHAAAVVGCSSDPYNRHAVSAGRDGVLRVWAFKRRALLREVACGSPVVHMKHHRPSSLVALAGADLALRVADFAAGKIVRTFKGHEDRITCLEITSDARWLLSGSMDGTVRAWDVPSATCLQVLRMDSPATSMSFSASLDLLATTHVGSRALHLWSNQMLFGNPAAIKPSTTPVDLRSDAAREDEDEEEEDEGAGSSDEEGPGGQEGELPRPDREVDESGAPRALAPRLVTLGGLPQSRWHGLANLEEIKRRNKPKEPPKKPAQAPFFLPTQKTLEGSYQVALDVTPDDADAEDEQGAAKLARGGGEVLPRLLREGQRSGSWAALAARAREMGPSQLDAELRALEPLNPAEPEEGEVALIAMLLEFLGSEVAAGRNFELANACLKVTLDAIGEVIASHEELRGRCEAVRRALGEAWGRTQGLLSEVQGLGAFLAGAQG